ncbi:MAG TPA: phosphate acyltransferase PlsX [Blastocatellia bacterium]|nr:phosphate acyltransferase PlsX [Blastocatellia bacterium]
MLKIAVDAMGGDFAPASEVEGALQAAREFGVGVVLVGRSEQIEAELSRHNVSPLALRGLKVEVLDAREVITMDDPVASAVRRKKNSSIRRAAELVKSGEAQGLVSAGSTGAVMMTAKLVLGALPHVDRPALAAVPTITGRGTVILDVGANAECKAVHLYQFAVMGSLYSNVIVGVERPKVGLLSIGEEEIKGNDLTKEAFKLLKSSSLNFIGNIEGRDMYTGQADVIVCDGFTGNVALKVSEGVIETTMKMLKEELMGSLQSKAGAILTRPAFQRFKQRLDYAEYGGAPLIGVKGVTVICHGRSSAKAIGNAIGVARDCCRGNINERLEAEIGQGAISAMGGHRGHAH